MTKQELIQKFEENIDKAKKVYDNGERQQMQMWDIIAMLEEQLKKLNESK